MALFSVRRLRRTALIAIGGLVMNAATPLLADAAAAIRGVPTGEICDVWGVRMPDAHAATVALPSHAHRHAQEASMPTHDHAAMAMALHRGDDDTDDAAMSTSMSDDGTTMMGDVPADDEVVAPPSHEHVHPAGLHGAGDHCALTALATFALPALPHAAPAAPPSVLATRRDAIEAPNPFDAVASWVLRLKHGPPRSA